MRTCNIFIYISTVFWVLFERYIARDFFIFL